jgi:hypothetical protein
MAVGRLRWNAANVAKEKNLGNWGLQMGIDAFGNELKEFRPDISQPFFEKEELPLVQPSNIIGQW